MQYETLISKEVSDPIPFMEIQETENGKKLLVANKKISWHDMNEISSLFTEDIYVLEFYECNILYNQTPEKQGITWGGIAIFNKCQLDSGTNIYNQFIYGTRKCSVLFLDCILNNPAYLLSGDASVTFLNCQINNFGGNCHTFFGNTLPIGVGNGRILHIEQCNILIDKECKGIMFDANEIFVKNSTFLTRKPENVQNHILGGTNVFIDNCSFENINNLIRSGGLLKINQSSFKNCNNISIDCLELTKCCFENCTSICDNTGTSSLKKIEQCVFYECGGVFDGPIKNALISECAFITVTGILFQEVLNVKFRKCLFESILTESIEYGYSISLIGVQTGLSFENCVFSNIIVNKSTKFIAFRSYPDYENGIEFDAQCVMVGCVTLDPSGYFLQENIGMGKELAEKIIISTKAKKFNSDKTELEYLLRHFILQYNIGFRSDKIETNNSICDNTTQNNEDVSYSISTEIRRIIENLPKFRTDIYKINRLDDVKSDYGLDDDAKIIAYCPLPGLFSTIESGGVIFTNQCIVEKFPGYNKYDYSTIRVEYENLVDYIPFFAFSKENEPQLIKLDKPTKFRSLGFSPRNSNQIHNRMVDVFWKIIDEMVSVNEDLKKRFENTQRKTIEELLFNYSICNNVESRELKLAEKLLVEKRWYPDVIEDATFYVFAGNMGKGNYLKAYECVENNTELFQEQRFKDRVFQIVEVAIERIGIPDSNSEVDALIMFSEKDERCLLLVYKVVIEYYFKNAMYVQTDQFIKKNRESELFDEIENYFHCICDKYISAFSEKWEDERNEEFFKYLLTQPAYYKIAGEKMINHYCSIQDFENATAFLLSIREITQDLDFADEMEEIVKRVIEEYTEEKYHLGCSLLEEGKAEEGISMFRKAIQYAPTNEKYVLKMVEAELTLADYRMAYKDIKEALRKNIQCSEENQEYFHSLEVQCAEGITQEMCAFYDLIKLQDSPDLSNDTVALSKTDQLGLNFYHYAIILKKASLVSKINVGTELVRGRAQSYPIMCFDCDDDTIDSTFIELLKLYDEDAKALYKTYKRKKKVDNVKQVGVGHS